MFPSGLGTAARRGTPSVAPTKEVTREGSVVYYSKYGHVMQLARAVEEGAKSVAGADVILRRVKEFPEVEQAHRQQRVRREDPRAAEECADRDAGRPACGRRCGR